MNCLASVAIHTSDDGVYGGDTAWEFGAAYFRYGDDEDSDDENDDELTWRPSRDPYENMAAYLDSDAEAAKLNRKMQHYVAGASRRREGDVAIGLQAERFPVLVLSEIAEWLGVAEERDEETRTAHQRWQTLKAVRNSRF